MRMDLLIGASSLYSWMRWWVHVQALPSAHLAPRDQLLFLTRASTWEADAPAYSSLRSGAFSVALPSLWLNYYDLPSKMPISLGQPITPASRLTLPFLQLFTHSQRERISTSFLIIFNSVTFARGTAKSHQGPKNITSKTKKWGNTQSLTFTICISHYWWYFYLFE